MTNMHKCTCFMILSRVPEWVYLSIQFFKCVRYENMYSVLGMGGGEGWGEGCIN
jgi:hypothetical protein